MSQPCPDQTCGKLQHLLTFTRNYCSHSALALRLLLTFALGFGAVATQAQTNPKHIFWIKGSPNAPNASSLASDLIYHGGNAGSGAIGVETKPAVYLIFGDPNGPTALLPPI